MEQMKLPLALAAAMATQLAAGVWWVSQQAATISTLSEQMDQLGSRMAIEDNVNLRRDVEDNAMEVTHLWDETDELWDEIDGMMMSIGATNNIRQRLAAIETELKYISRDHNMIDMKGGND